MKKHHLKPLILAASLLTLLATEAAAQYSGWQHSGSMFILTTPEGADLPASAAEKDFPLLVRLHKDFFDFSQAKADGADVRFSTSAGEPLAYQIEEWDAASGTASIWVRIPLIKGNARQEIKLHWGKADAASESSGSAVFNESNGYLSVWHMNEPVKDEVGTLESKDVGTTATAGMIGPARHLAGQQGVFGGDKITNYPTGAVAHTSEAWFRPEKPNVTVLAWGNEQGQGKVVMQFRSPPHINMDCYFSEASMAGRSAIPMSEWVHVAYVYQRGDARIYVNGALDSASKGQGTPLNIRSPARLWLGGWYHHYDFVGDLDEVRVSKVARSADWVRLEYENQKPLQTLVGPLVQPGGELSVSPAQASVAEGQSCDVFRQSRRRAEALLDSPVRRAREPGCGGPIDVHTRCGPRGGRADSNTPVQGDLSRRCEDKRHRHHDQGGHRRTRVHTAGAGAMGRARNRRGGAGGFQSRRDAGEGCGRIEIVWSVSGLATIKEIMPDKLILRRAQNSGPLSVTLALSNGGVATTQTTTIAVHEPTQDAWVQRSPAGNEKPEDNQFFARDDRNEGRLHCNGTLAEPADSVFLRVYADDKLITTETQKPNADRTYVLRRQAEARSREVPHRVRRKDRRPRDGPAHRHKSRLRRRLPD